MIVNERYSVTSDQYQWILTEVYIGKDKEGKPKEQERKTYHPRFRHLIEHVINQEAKSSVSLADLYNKFDRATDEIAGKIKFDAAVEDLEARVRG